METNQSDCFFNVEVLVDGKEIVLEFPSCITIEALQDLTDYLSVIRPEAAPFLRDKAVHLSLGREPQNEREFHILGRWLKQTVECWLNCYHRAFKEKLQGRNHLKVVK